MSEITNLTQRIKAEFEARASAQKERKEAVARQGQVVAQRLERFGKVCEELKGVWGPRLEEFAKQFGDKIKVKPTLSPAQREAKMSFLTDLANVTLTLQVSLDADRGNLVLNYDLLIIPMLMEYERHSRLEMSLDKIDRAAVGTWVDDRLVAFVKTYLSMLDNEFYIKRGAALDDGKSKKPAAAPA